MSRTLRLVLRAALIAGIVIVAGLAWWRVPFTQLGLNGEYTTGTVDSPPDVVTRNDGADYYRAWVVYRDENGNEHRQYIRIPDGALRGTQFTVLYDPGNPANVDWRGRGGHLGVALGLPVVALLVVVIGLVLERRATRSFTRTQR